MVCEYENDKESCATGFPALCVTESGGLAITCKIGLSRPLRTAKMTVLRVPCKLLASKVRSD
jgi:hypothetical protein